VTEVCCDIAMGFAGQILWLVILMETLTTEPLMKSSIGSQGVFFIFGAFCVVGTLFNYFFVAETKGLSEKEKKSLYLPGSKFGRELKINEKGQMYMRVSLRERKLSVSSISDKDFKRSTLRSKPRMVSS
jgi:hypothetical protein